MNRRSTILCFAALTTMACGGAPVIAPAPVAAPSVTWAFTAPWDAHSDSSVRSNASNLDGIVSGWIQLDSVTALPSLPFGDTVTLGTTPRFALVTSWHGQRFHPETVRRLGTDSTLRSSVILSLGALVRREHYSGVVFDFEDHAPADTAVVARVIGGFARTAKANGAQVTAVAIPATDTTAYPTRTFAALADFVIVMLYDEHWSTSPPGPIASPDWVRRALGQRVADVGGSRVVAAFPLYSYLWRPDQPAEPLSAGQALRRASEANVEIRRDPGSQALHATQSGAWDLWMSDAEQLRVLQGIATSLGVHHIALWRLGQEDPAVWAMLTQGSKR